MPMLLARAQTQEAALAARAVEGRARLARLWRRAIAAARDELLVVEIEAAARAGDRTRLMAALLPAVVRLQEVLAAELPELLMVSVEHGAAIAERFLPQLIRAAAVAEDLLDDEDDVASLWAHAQADSAIGFLVDDLEAALLLLVARAASTRSFMERTHPDGPLPARLLANLAVRTVGLTAKQTDSVIAFAARLHTADGGAIISAGSKTFRVPADGADAEFIDRATQKIADGLMTKRAEAFASDQTQRALAEGQREVWADAQEDGLLAEFALKRLKLGPNPCKVCIAIEAAGPVSIAVGFDSRDAQFDTGSPPFHTNCQCTEELM